uniref:Pan3_PK domain-containing protein n=1 Tax=Macrostomum lignano TaxID=282301 RepID=A0A1I8JS14_9PLAT
MSSSDHRLFYGSGGLLSSMPTANSSDNANQFYAQSRSATGQSQTQYASNSGATAAAALGVRMHGMGMTPQHSRSLITGQHAISAAATAAANRSQTASLVAGTSFYDANNLDEVKKMQSAGKLTSPSWYAQLPAFTERGDGVTYMDAELRRSLLSRIHFALIVPDAQLSATLPPALLHYEQLAPLETQLKRSGTFGLPSLCYKAFNGKDQTWVMLRRFVGVGQMQARLVGQQLESLRKLEHPHLVPVRHVFATDAFGDDSVCLVTDFFPGSTTLLSSHCSDPLKVNGFNSPFNIDGQARPISSIKSRSQSHVQSEAIVWHMLLQLLASAVRACHARHSRAVRLLDPSKIIIDVEASRAGQQQRPRLRVNCLGAREILGAIGASFSDPAQAEEELVKAKQQDLVDLGKLLLVLSCGTTVALQDLNTSIYDVMPAIGARFFDHLCESQQRVDFLEAQLTKQLENGRLFRLAQAEHTVCERELPADPAWPRLAIGTC